MFTNVHLTPQRVTQIAQLSIQNLHRPDMKVEAYLDSCTQDMVLRMERYLYGTKLSDFTVKHPADWFEALKERWFPAWLLKRYPVLYTHHRVEQHAVFPDWVAPAQDRLGPVSLMVVNPNNGKCGLFSWED